MQLTIRINTLLLFLGLGLVLGGIQKNLPETKTATLNPDSSGITFETGFGLPVTPLKCIVTCHCGEVPDPAKK